MSASTEKEIVRLSVLVPTRGRPKRLVEMLNSLSETADHIEEVEVILYINDDDTDTLQLELNDWPIKRVIGSQESMGTLNTACLRESCGDIIILGNDDVIVRTMGWDSKISQAVSRFSEEVFLIYPNDLHKGPKFSTFPILSRRTCETIGSPFPSEYQGSFIDLHLFDIFKRLEGRGYPRIQYLEDVVFEHFNFRTGKAPIDDTYLRRQRFGDDHTFLMLNEVREQAAERLVGQIENGAASKPGNNSFRPKQQGFISLNWSVLRDGTSPLRWRAWLYYWMWARKVYYLLTKLVFTRRRINRA